MSVRDRARQWLLYDGNRLVVAALGLVALFFAFGPLGHAFTGAEGQPLSRSGTVVPLLTTLLSGNFLLVSIVVSVNSLFVSGEQNPLGQQFGRIQSIAEFRNRLETITEFDHIPPEPAAFLRVLTGDVVERAQYLREEIPATDFEFREDFDAYLDDLGRVTGDLNDSLDEAAGPLDVVLATLEYDYDRQVNDLRRLRAEGDGDLPEQVTTTIEDMLDLLQYFATTREYFKTLYFRREFANLSRDLLFVALPAIAVMSYALLHIDQLPRSHWLVVSVHVVSLAPIALLAAYVLRVVAIAKRTESAGQFAVYEHPERAGGIPRRSE
mgnify:CR=1 FL=1